MTISNQVEVTQDPPTVTPPTASITLTVVTPAPPAHLASSGGQVTINVATTGIADGTVLHLFTSPDGTTWTDSTLTATVANGVASFSWQAGPNTGTTPLTWFFEASDNSPPA